MTQMSDQRIVSSAAAYANSATAEVRSRLARPLHGGLAIRVLVTAMLFSGCVIPPSLSVDTTDAGLNSAPTIISVRADGVEIPEWSSVTFERGLGTLNLVVYDTDVDDTLHPEIFVDYNNPDATPARAVCTAASGDSVQRSSTCDLAGLCFLADIGKERIMQVVVFDREIVEGQLPLHQAMLPPGLSTSKSFFLRCVEKQQ